MSATGSWSRPDAALERAAELAREFLAGLADIDARAAALGTPRFVDMQPAGRLELFTTLDVKRTDKAGAGHAVVRLKALTVYGYFTSRKVQQDVLKTRMFFNGYDGNVPFTPAV